MQPYEIRIRLRGKGETDAMAQKRKAKLRKAQKRLVQQFGRKVSEAEVIRWAVDDLSV